MRAGALLTEVSTARDAVLRSYAIVFFSHSRRVGAAFLAATLMAPLAGLIGLAGLLISYVTARLLGFETRHIRSGLFLFNSLLVALALSYLHHQQPLHPLALALVLAAASVLTLLLSVLLSTHFLRQYGLPALSLPFVTITFLLFFVFFSLGGPVAPSTPGYLPGLELRLPPPYEGFLQSFGAIFFLPSTAVGLLVATAVLLWSRLAFIYAALGYAAGVLLLWGLGEPLTPALLGFTGFNFIVTAIALGGIFFIPTRSGLLLMVFGVVCCALVAVAVKAFLVYFGMPPLALPFNLTVLLILYSLQQRTRARYVLATPFEPGSPEQNFRRFNISCHRFPAMGLVHLYTPFFGIWRVTQGFDGRHTHRDEWREALDFELWDTRGKAFEGHADRLENYHSYGSPVVSPCSGTVTRVVEQVRDNAIGTVNLDQNWGNLVMIRSDAGPVILLCHLQRGSLKVAPQQRVSPGTLLGACGNSGRSPTPHLHVQAQWSDQVGGPTTPFRLTQYVEEQAGGWRFHTSGLPGEGARIAALRFDERMSGTVDSLASGSFGFSLERGDGTEREILHSRIDPDGHIVLSSEQWKRTRLKTRVTDRVWYMLEFEGSTRSLLFHLWLGLNRLPLSLQAGLWWRDRMELRHALRPVGGYLFDLWGPFAGYPVIRTETRLHPGPDSHAGRRRLAWVDTELQYDIPARLRRPESPNRVRVHLSRQEGIIGLESESPGNTLRAKRID